MNATAQTAGPLTASWLYWALGFVGGYGDAAGFVLARTFTGHATGNLVLGAIATAAGDFRSALNHFSAVFAFLMGVFLGAWTMRPLKLSRLSAAMTLELILILASPLLLSARLAGTQLFVTCVSLALGLQNGAFRRAGGISVHTTYLTGMITSLISSETERYSAGPFLPAVSAYDPKVALTVQIWATFVLGAITGAAATFHFKQWGMLGIGVILLVVMILYSTKEYSVAQIQKPR
jgi:uncharacterized membrane protein YoaK (UPF0700 family)